VIKASLTVLLLSGKDTYKPCPRRNVLDNLLECSNPPAEHPTLKPKSCGRVLTSAQNFKFLEEKEAKKLEQR